MQNLSTCLWFDCQAEEAAAFYVAIFPNSTVLSKKHYLEGSPGKAGEVMAVEFRLNGSDYLALNGGPLFKFSPAISLMANCDTQEEVDTLWHKLLEGGQASQCGWLTDRFGVSWQVVPRAMIELLDTADKAASQRAVAAMMTMVKLDLAVIQQAYAGT